MDSLYKAYYLTKKDNFPRKSLFRRIDIDVFEYRPKKTAIVDYRDIKSWFQGGKKIFGKHEPPFSPMEKKENTIVASIEDDKYLFDLMYVYTDDGEHVVVFGFEHTKRLLSMNFLHVEVVAGEIVEIGMTIKKKQHTRIPWKYWIYDYSLNAVIEHGFLLSPDKPSFLVTFWDQDYRYYTPHIVRIGYRSVHDTPVRFNREFYRKRSEVQCSRLWRAGNLTFLNSHDGTKVLICGE